MKFSKYKIVSYLVSNIPIKSFYFQKDLFD